MRVFRLFLASLLLPFLAQGAETEKKIFVKCTPEALKAAFDDTFTSDTSQKFSHPISGEEIAVQGFRKLGTKVFEDSQGNPQFRERRKILERFSGDSGRHVVYCNKGEAVAVTLAWPATLGELFEAMKEKYQWNITKSRFIDDVNKFISKGIVYLVKDEEDRLITVTIGKVDETTHVRVHYYQPALVREEIELLLKEDENRKKKDEERYKKAKGVLL
jgi:hypothetical protein